MPSIKTESNISPNILDHGFIGGILEIKSKHSRVKIFSHALQKAWPEFCLKIFSMSKTLIQMERSLKEVC